MRVSWRHFSALGLLVGIAVFSAGCGASRPAQAIRPLTTPVLSALPAKPLSITHTVAPKETLWAISKRYGVAINRLAQMNGRKINYRVMAGEKLLIPE